MIFDLINILVIIYKDLTVTMFLTNMLCNLHHYYVFTYYVPRYYVGMYIVMC